MILLRTNIALLLVLTLSLMGVRAENKLDLALDWNINGSNTLRGTVYGANGAGSGSPYPFEGDMYFDELSVFFNKQDSEYASWRGELTGLYNINDDYRSADFGLVPERVNLTRENGSTGIPYRAEFGDYFAYYSYLTLQRSLKGAQLELQPFANERQLHSIVITTGANESNWRDLTPSDDWFNGMSWLVQDRDWGSWSFNVAHNYRDEVSRLNTLERNQYTFSVAGEVPIQYANHNFSIEAEAAHFRGDHNGTSGAASGQDRAENGYLVEMRGNHQQLPWDYRFRFEHYGRDFRPTGAVVTPDRRSYELHSGWRFDNGIRMRLRAQLFQDAYETTNRQRTRTYGVNFTGPLLNSFYPGLTGRLDAFIQNRDNELATVSQLSRTLNLSLNAPLPYDWTGRLGVFIQNTENRLGGAGDNLTRQITIGADRLFNFYGWQGYITPGLNIRTSRKGNNDGEDIGPTIAFRLSKDQHALNMNYGSLIQDRRSSLNGVDVDTHTFNLDYNYRYKEHTFGLEANVNGRDPDPGNNTEAYRVSAYWTVEFDRPAVRTTARTLQTTGADKAAEGNIRIDIARLGPGTTSSMAATVLDAAKVKRGTPQSGYVLYETPVIQNVFQRQRLALKYEGGVLRESVVVIDFDEVGDRDSDAQNYERIRQSLIRQLGGPSRTYEEGEFGPNLNRDVNSERFIRITEWKTQQGTIRFGIPRRLDGQVRMEIQHGIAFPSPRDTLWSAEGIR